MRGESKEKPACVKNWNMETCRCTIWGYDNQNRELCIYELQILCEDLLKTKTARRG